MVSPRRITETTVRPSRGGRRGDPDPRAGGAVQSRKPGAAGGAAPPAEFRSPCECAMRPTLAVIAAVSALACLDPPDRPPPPPQLDPAPHPKGYVCYRAPS